MLQSQAITQPRRVASITVASREAKEMRTRVGDKVGYKIRFENRTRRSETKIVFLTDGVLLRECLGGDLSSRYRFVILDEAHELAANAQPSCTKCCLAG